MKSSTQLENAHKNNHYSSHFELGMIEKSNQILLANLQGDNVLELGCGLGLTTSALVKANKQVTVVEQSPYFIEQTKKLINDRKVLYINSPWEDVEVNHDFSDVVIFRGLDCVENVDAVFQKLIEFKEASLHVVITNTNSFHRILGEKIDIDKVDSLTKKADQVGRLQSLNYSNLVDYFNAYNMEIQHFEGIAFKMFPNDEMDTFSDERIKAFLDMGKEAGKHAVELYFKVKIK